MRKRGTRKRPGFTLVELLVVIVIIAILAGFLVVGVMAGMRRAKEAAIRTEIMGMAGALETYKNDYDYYPPSASGELQAHFSRNFPRSSEVVPDLPIEHVLHFWLDGYAPDAEKPLFGVLVDGVTKGRPTPFFEFDKERLIPVFTDPKDEDNLLKSRPRAYYPKGARGNIPYIYFRKIYDENTQTYRWGNQEYGTGDIGKIFFEDEVLKVTEGTGGGGTHVVARNISKDFVIVSAGLESKYTKDGILTSVEDGSKSD